MEGDPTWFPMAIVKGSGSLNSDSAMCAGIYLFSGFLRAQLRNVRDSGGPGLCQTKRFLVISEEERATKEAQPSTPLGNNRDGSHWLLCRLQPDPWEGGVCKSCSTVSLAPEHKGGQVGLDSNPNPRMGFSTQILMLTEPFSVSFCKMGTAPWPLTWNRPENDISQPRKHLENSQPGVH